MDLESYDSCSHTFSSIYDKFPDGALEVCVNFTRHQVGRIKEYCSDAANWEVGSKKEDEYGKPMVWIGIYVSVASIICILAMLADLWNGLRYRKLMVRSNYFSLNVVSITVIGVAMKLPMDLTTPMGEDVDQAAKVGSLAFMCAIIVSLMPSLASIDNKDLAATVIGLAILIITIIVDVIIQMITGIIDSDWVHYACIYVAILLFLLIVSISFAISVPVTKEILELRYQAISSTTLYDHHTHDRFIIERLRQHVTRYAIMVQTSSPHFVMTGNVLSSAAYFIIYAFGLSIYLSRVRLFLLFPEYLFISGSQYKWSTCTIGITQFVGNLVCFIGVRNRLPVEIDSFETFGIWNRRHLPIFKVEKYWTQKLYELKESHISFLLGGRRSRSVFRNLKKPILSLCIGIQKATVVTCKLICYIEDAIVTLYFPIFKILDIILIGFRILVSYCTNYLNCCNMQNDVPPSNSDTNEDLARYIVLLDDNLEHVEKTFFIKRLSRFVNRVIQTAEKEQDNDLLKLLKKSTGFKGVLEFDTYQVQPSFFLDLPNSWSLPIATLACIAIAIPNIGGGKTDNLLKSVGKALSYTHLVDESLNGECKYINVQNAVVTLWDEVEDKYKWLGNTLEKSAYEGKTSKEILEWFSHKAEEIVNHVENSITGEPMEKLPQKLIVANSMKRIAQTIMDAHNNSEITKKQLFALLSRMIADILLACFSNIPRVIAMKCHESAIERREASVEAAAKLLGRTTEIIKIISNHELPSMDPDKLAFIDEWHLHLQHIP